MAVPPTSPPLVQKVELEGAEAAVLSSLAETRSLGLLASCGLTRMVQGA